MKLMLDSLPDDLYYCPEVISVKEEALGGNSMYYRGNQENLPWIDIPYPIFSKDGKMIKENYDVNLINGEVYFGEEMTGAGTSETKKN